MLLDNIIELATKDDQSITVLLRKCIVLAHRIKNETLKSWANKELDGYANDDELPDYRVIGAQAKGHFNGWGGSRLNHFPIPPAVLEEKHRQFATKVYLRQAVAAYEHLVKTAKSDGRITLEWPPNLVLHYQERIPLTQPMALVAAYQEIQKPTLVKLLDTVRNRVLNVALEIQSEVGERDEDLKQITPKAEEKIERYVSQQIFNGNVYVTTDQSSMTIQQQNIATGDWKQLEQVLRRSGLSQPDLDDLSTAVTQDQNKIGSTVKGWIEKTGPKVLSGGIKMASSVGQAILTEYLKHYFGPK
ncbi:MAG TPA: hypothetical protein VH117_07220 [Edaphobacter sp.]|jgi:hypothetical protein|nr:hypothetical protein [Edaphobacter sp.]